MAHPERVLPLAEAQSCVSLWVVLVRPSMAAVVRIRGLDGEGICIIITKTDALRFCWEALI